MTDQLTLEKLAGAYCDHMKKWHGVDCSPDCLDGSCTPTPTPTPTPTWPVPTWPGTTPTPAPTPVEPSPIDYRYPIAADLAAKGKEISTWYRRIIANLPTGTVIPITGADGQEFGTWTLYTWGPFKLFRWDYKFIKNGPEILGPAADLRTLSRAYPEISAFMNRIFPQWPRGRWTFKHFEYFNNPGYCVSSETGAPCDIGCGPSKVNGRTNDAPDETVIRGY